MCLKFYLEKRTESKLKVQRTLLSKIVLNGLKFVDTYIIFFLLKCKYKLNMINVNNLLDADNKPIVSLTSFPSRLNNLWMVLYCMYNQTYRPGKIVVTLIRSEIVGGYESLPNSLKYFADKGVEFLFEDENLKPHNKYFYTRQKYPDRVIITIDDDLLYYSDTIDRLMKLHEKYPDAVCSNRVHKVHKENGVLKKYSTWNDVFIPMGPSNNLIALGYSSVLYPPSFHNELIYDAEKIKKLSLCADDIWLYVMEVLSNTNVVVGDYYAHPITLPSSQQIALQDTNNATESRNDLYLKLLEGVYNFTSMINV